MPKVNEAYISEKKQVILEPCPFCTTSSGFCAHKLNVTKNLCFKYKQLVIIY